MVDRVVLRCDAFVGTALVLPAVVVGVGRLLVGGVGSCVKSLSSLVVMCGRLLVLVSG